MQIQPTPAPLAFGGQEAAARPQEGPTVTKAETPRPVDATFKDPPPPVSLSGAGPGGRGRHQGVTAAPSPCVS